MGARRMFRDDEYEDDEDDEDGEDRRGDRGGRGGRGGGRAADGFATLDRRLATMPRHAPWTNLAWVVTEIPQTTALDVSVNDRVFEAFARVSKESRGRALEKSERKHIVTLILESEMDVWGACGGSTNRLPKKTWITRRGEPPLNPPWAREATIRSTIRETWRRNLKSGRTAWTKMKING